MPFHGRDIKMMTLVMVGDGRTPYPSQTVTWQRWQWMSHVSRRLFHARPPTRSGLKNRDAF